MTETTTVVAGIVIPSTSPLFLTIVAVHVVVSSVCVVTGLIAMLSAKQPGRHPRLGSTYYWFLLIVFASAALLSWIRWEEDKALFGLGLVSFVTASIGRAAMRGRWRNWMRVHIAGMGTSYVFLLIAFYVDNGKNLPIWRDLPPSSYWIVPLAVGMPLIVRALLYHPLIRLAASGMTSNRE